MNERKNKEKCDQIDLITAPNGGIGRGEIVLEGTQPKNGLEGKEARQPTVKVRYHNAESSHKRQMPRPHSVPRARGWPKGG